ncbi:unnamed protein product [Pleuronectes platessa]|uniref:Inter-alpha-trypsin inhibitor heavy chain H6 n=1 Tax=Pleuronectes platessa TaxID=8262 RepID=A0A9N7V1X2_PLEPL|nr:unnamed protein product [Pleuronectes platessa]
MDVINVIIWCFLVLFTFYMQGGLSEEYEAHLGANIRLQRVKRQSKPAKPVLQVTDFHVRCSVASRYAVTTVQSSVWNQLPVLKEAAFEVDLPSAAFISNFSITSNSKVEREIEKFRVAVSVPSGAHMSFSLSYEELLPRRLGRYELSLGLRPGQLVQNLTLDVGITERTGISFIKVLPLKTSRLLSNTATGEAGDAPASTQVEQSSGCARVRFSPTLQQQSSISPGGLDADFTVQYDVDLRDVLGDVQVYDGYFVHYFAPRGLPVVPKDVIFVIDVSGSMIGTKIKQTKQAMSTILADLREGDHFNIITFSDKVHTWRTGRTVRATRQNVRDAREFVKRIIAEGWTNINAALLSAAQLVNPPSSNQHTSRRVPLVIFLTDGEATIGVTAGDTILSNAKKALGSASLFGLAFGDDADLLLLKRLALDNRGVARMVYEEADAALQLKGFYDEVASPLLSDIQLSYLDDQAFDITRSMFPNYFQGSELVVAGRVRPGVRDFQVSMSATDSKQRVNMENDVSVSQAKGNESAGSLECPGALEGVSSFVQRLWAYYTIKELLLAKLNTSDPAAQRLLADKATNLSLKYNFVTPVTSLVVVKPDADEAAPTPTTVKPTTAATITTTGTTTATTKPAADGAVKKHSSASNSRPSRTRPDSPQPPPNRKNSSPTSTARTSSRKTTTTSVPSSVKTAPAPLSGKKNDSRSGSPPPAGRISTPLLRALRTAAPPAPGKLSSTPQPTAMKTTTPSTPAFTTTSPLSSVRSVPAPLTERHLTPQPNTSRTDLPPVKVTAPPTELENSSTSAPDVPQPGNITSLPEPTSPLTSPPPPAPAVEDNDTNAVGEPEISFATLVSATFAPMPGVTDGPRLWEAAGLLDVSTSIQIQRKDYEATYDYDYDLNYDAWDDSADTGSFEPPSRLSTVRVFSSSVDGDPHFVLQLPKLHQNLCFTVDGRADDVLRLLEDPDRGIIVDGHLIGAPSKHGSEDRTRTYFDRLTISSAAGGILITVSLEAVVVEGEGRDLLPINQQGSVLRQGVAVAVDKHQSCRIELARDVRFLVLFHHYKHPSYLQMAHLGFYITDGRGLSASTQGLLGQFQHADLSVTGVKGRVEVGASARGLLRWGSDHVPVTLQDKTLKDSVRRRHQGKCWVVPKAEVHRLLGHPYESYVVDHV